MAVSESAIGGKANGSDVLDPSRDTNDVDRCLEATVDAIIAKGVDRATIIEALIRTAVALARGR